MTRYLFAAGLAALTAATVTYGHLAAQQPDPANLGYYAPAPTAGLLAPLALPELQPVQISPGRDFPTYRTAAAAGVGSLAGLLGGTLYGRQNGSHRDLALGLLVGSFVGAGIGAATVSDRPGPSLLGSALGVLGGLAMTSLMPGGGNEVAFVSYSFTHGAIAALVARAFR